MQIRESPEVGELEFKWVREYGYTWRTKGCFGSDVIWTADPKALQYVYQTSGYRFSKTKLSNETAKLMMGPGIVVASAHEHPRHRRVMNPAFSAAQVRSFLPTFKMIAGKLVQKWKDQLQTDDQSGATIDVSKGLSRMSMDIIGEAAFNHQLNTLEGHQNELSDALDHLFIDTIPYPRAWDLMWKATWDWIPSPLLLWIKYIPTKEYSNFAHYRNTSTRVGKQLLNAGATEDKSKDVLSILVRANAAEDARGRLAEPELLSQISTLLLAGQDTSSSTLTWSLYELARHPEDQQKVRDEVLAARERVRERGLEDISPADLDGMPFTNAVIKETLRLHPIVPTLMRQADYDDVLPLAQPIVTRTGEKISEIPLPKGTQITASIASYNRNPEVWGQDADEWNPMRFLNQKTGKANVGVFANLMTFCKNPDLYYVFYAHPLLAGGIRGCIGWRFAVLEIQAVLTEMLENFKFGIDKDVEVIRLNAGLMMPLVKGRETEGVLMPLKVSAL
ncbi:PAH-inducible cytochrome P450 monooxygenase PC-PAH 1 [Coniophora puteana RWD-64-598 SS2]|uniref:PAH-inducible cytochrome P450 monooxygenase PC-PAH 1 n=1 Tax=Coniophora puteana (strain RWD-64-598) TaxID=741705 RepID=A0A5M3MYL5_CONPW|nr:PAH-inducible cytochrome P450 monooxygenase PC-PAH 1 [Coniophora puteana RWD-64-598 SS2]EIW84209.1 PAH-inducible cytochrome P450 monooxygenase PC-PAH 1 [Coniophora puteana RWD-64-598 SS2]